MRKNLRRNNKKRNTNHVAVEHQGQRQQAVTQEQVI